MNVSTDPSIALQLDLLCGVIRVHIDNACRLGEQLRSEINLRTVADSQEEDGKIDRTGLNGALQRMRQASMNTEYFSEKIRNEVGKTEINKCWQEFKRRHATKFGMQEALPKSIFDLAKLTFEAAVAIKTVDEETWYDGEFVGFDDGYFPPMLDQAWMMVKSETSRSHWPVDVIKLFLQGVTAQGMAHAYRDFPSATERTTLDKARTDGS